MGVFFGEEGKGFCDGRGGNLEDDAADCEGVDLAQEKWVLASAHEIVCNTESE